MSPGGYLLSRDLSSDYHRRADVSLPGSEWDRVGPSGYDHQVARSFELFAHRLSGRSCVCRAAVKGGSQRKQQTDIRVAVVMG